MHVFYKINSYNFIVLFFCIEISKFLNFSNVNIKNKKLQQKKIIYVNIKKNYKII